MDGQASIFIGAGEAPQHLPLALANRHGLIAGATGTGKTVSLRVLAEGFSASGVPVFVADVKGDLSGISQQGEEKAFIAERAEKLGIGDFAYRGFPTVFWDLYGEQGHPVRTTVSEMGPMLLARLLELNDTQEGILDVVFEVADHEGMLLLDFKDLRAMLGFVADNAQTLRTRFGNVSAASVGAIQRRLLGIGRDGGELFFGEPALELADFLTTDRAGFGYINVLAADRLIRSPRLYATFLLWLLSELFEELPEVGDPAKPKLVFFFDEAHLLFGDAPKALRDTVTQVVRLIRSKGVGVYFVSQTPADIPDEVLGQLGNRIQHALRSFTPRDAKAVKTAADTFRPNPRFNAAEVIGQLAVGEALVSTLQPGGVPGIVERTLIRPPCSRLRPAESDERRGVMAQSPVAGKYDRVYDRESAFEILERWAERAAAEAEASRRPPSVRAPAAGGRTSGPSRRQGPGEALAKSVMHSVGRQIGRELMRGLFGTLTRRR